MSNKQYSKYGSNHLSEYCDEIVADFFRFCEGDFDNIKTMVYKDDLVKNVAQRKPEQRMGMFLSRLDTIWRKFCKDQRLPLEMNGLLMKRVKEEWQRRGEQQKAMEKRKRKRKSKS